MQVFWALHESGMMNLVLYIASSENEKQYYFHVLEVSSAAIGIITCSTEVMYSLECG